MKNDHCESPFRNQLQWNKGCLPLKSICLLIKLEFKFPYSIFFFLKLYVSQVGLDDAVVTNNPQIIVASHNQGVFLHQATYLV